MKRFLSKLLKTKNTGSGDLFASLVVLVALTLFCYYFINVIADIDSRIQVDQVARKYILRMESSGELSASERSAMETDLSHIKAVKKAIDAGNAPVITWSGNNVAGTRAGYGGTITLSAKVPIYMTTYDPDTNIMGTIGRDRLVWVNVTKQSTAKY